MSTKPAAQHPAQADAPPPASALFERAYQEIKKLARHVRRGAGPATLNTTALVHEAFVKLRAHQGDDPEHLKALVTRAMRQILVDHARRRGADKRGGGATVVTLGGIAQAEPARGFDLVAVDRALSDLEALSPRLAAVVELHVFGGFNMGEIGAQLGVTERTVFREWRKARAFLVDRLN